MNALDKHQANKARRAAEAEDERARYLRALRGPFPGGLSLRDVWGKAGGGCDIGHSRAVLLQLAELGEAREQDGVWYATRARPGLAAVPTPPPGEPETDGQWCKRRRLEARLSQEQLAIRVRDRAGLPVGQAYVSAFERGQPSGPLTREALEVAFAPLVVSAPAPDAPGVPELLSAQEGAEPASCGGGEGGGREPSPASEPAPAPPEPPGKEPTRVGPGALRQLLLQAAAELEQAEAREQELVRQVAELQAEVVRLGGQLEAVRQVLGVRP